MKYGILLIGAYGHISTTVMVGTLALAKGLCSNTGMVTGMDVFSKMKLVEPESIVLGGWDIRKGSIMTNVHSVLSEINYLEPRDIASIEEDLSAISKFIYKGTTKNCGSAITSIAHEKTDNRTLEETIHQLKADIEHFKTNNNLDQIAVINVSSTEPLMPEGSATITLDQLNKRIEENDAESIRPSTLYAYAAIDSGCAFINFTPSEGAQLPGLTELAEKKQVPISGSDGKTGETLVKSVLAPMFTYRNLNVLSWEGYNLLGNMDGQILSDPDNKTSKIMSKDNVLSKVLGYQPHSNVSIDYVPSLGDRKTAWDFIHFEGFLNTKMSLQFTWQGCDSALAAPLVLDLARLCFFAMQKGEIGIMKHLACFFKSPMGTKEHNLHKQFNMLTDYVKQHA